MHPSLHNNKIGHLFPKQPGVCLGCCVKRKENFKKQRDYIGWAGQQLRLRVLYLHMFLFFGVCLLCADIGWAGMQCWTGSAEKYPAL